MAARERWAVSCHRFSAKTVMQYWYYGSICVSHGLPAGGLIVVADRVHSISYGRHLLAMQYRTEIDGLRAVAVIAVILYHAGLPLTSGGYVGVDIFFVISGYLITGIVMREFSEGHFSFARFYARRARRILPALLLILFASIPFAWFWLLPHAFRNYTQSMLAALFSYANIHFWTQSGYFETENTVEPLLHTWSLATEEQFYLILPLLLFILMRRGKRRAIPLILAGIATASFLLCEVLVRVAPEANFYLLPSRMWELIAGALLSFAPAGRGGRLDNALAVFGLLMIGTSIFIFNDHTPTPSILTLLPVVGACLVLRSATDGTSVANVLRQRPLVLIGLISYSAYLWHQPIFAFARLRAPESPGVALMSILIVLSFVLAWFSWRFVEQPFRLRRQQQSFGSQRLVLAGGCLVILGLSVFALIGNVSRGLPNRLPTDLQDFDKDYSFSRRCLFNQRDDQPKLPNTACVFHEDSLRRVVLWGDSVASSIAPRLADVLGRQGVSLEQLTVSSCAPVVGVSPLDVPTSQMCMKFNKDVAAYIKTDGADTVILAAAWRRFLTDSGHQYDGPTSEAKPDNEFEMVATHLDDTINLLQSYGLRVVLVYPHIEAMRPMKDVVAGLRMRGIDDISLSVPADVVRKRIRQTAEWLDTVGNSDVLRVDPNKLFCDRDRAICLLASDGKPILSDTLHFSLFGASYVASSIVDALGLHSTDLSPLQFTDARTVGDLQ